MKKEMDLPVSTSRLCLNTDREDSRYKGIEEKSGVALKAQGQKSDKKRKQQYAEEMVHK